MGHWHGRAVYSAIPSIADPEREPTAMAADRTSMSAVDAAWMRMDRPTNLMMVVGVLVFEQPLNFRRFRKLIAERFLRFERFRCRPVDGAGGATWRRDGSFDLDAHLRRVALPQPSISIGVY